MKLKLTAVLALVILFLAMAPGTVKAEGIELVYDLNFSRSLIHQESWNRLEVTVANNDREDLQGVVTVSAGGAYSQEVFVEAGKKAVLIFYLPPNSLDGSWSGSSAYITVTNSRGRELKRIRFTVGTHNSLTNYIGVLGGELQGLTELANIFPNSQRVGIKPEHLDNLPFAENFTIIVINDPQPVMISSQQKENLRLWVEQGGTLILGGGSGWQRTLDLVPADLAPIKPQGVGAVSAQDLEALKLPLPIPQQQYTVALGESLGTVLQRTGGIPLLVQRNFGQGVVLWSALDLTAPPLDTEGNSIAFWRQLVQSQPGMAKPELSRQSWVYNNIFNNISQGQVASALSPLKIFLVLLAYIVLAGPINWLILRKLDRREWAWLTIPVLAVLFTTGTFAVGSLGRGSERVLYQLNLIQVQSENLAKVECHGGVFVPGRGKVSITPQAAALAPMAGGVVTQTGNGATLIYDNPPMWSVQRFFASDYLELPGDFSVAAKMEEYKTNSLAVEVLNDSNQPLFDSYLRLGNSWYQVGPLEAGERKTVAASSLSHLNFSGILQRYSGSAPWVDVEELLPNAPFLFLGFGDTGVIPATGTEAVVALDMWVQPLSMSNIDFSQETVDIPRGVLTPEVLPGLGGFSDRWGNQYEFRGQGSFDLVFSLPAGLDYSQGEYYLNLSHFWGDAVGDLTVYNYLLGEWQELSSLDALYRSPRAIRLEDLGAVIQNDRLLLRVNYESGSLGFYVGDLDITVEGGRFSD
jgi:hypothetical protein